MPNLKKWTHTFKDLYWYCTSVFDITICFKTIHVFTKCLNTNYITDAKLTIFLILQNTLQMVQAQLYPLIDLQYLRHNCIYIWILRLVSRLHTYMHVTTLVLMNTKKLSAMQKYQYMYVHFWHLRRTYGTIKLWPKSWCF